MGFLNETTDFKGSKIYTAAHQGADGKPTTRIEVTGSKVEEQKTQANATAGVVTFAQNIQYIGIYNRDTVNDGVFTVNGIALTIPKGESAEFNVGGTPAKTVSVSGSTSYIVTRYV